MQSFVLFILVLLFISSLVIFTVEQNQKQSNRQLLPPVYTMRMIKSVVAMAMILMASAVVVDAMAVPSRLVATDNKNDLSKSQTPAAILPSSFSSLRGGDVVLRSKRRYAPIQGVYLTVASVVVLLLPSISLQLLQVAAVTILVSSLLEYTTKKGFL